jgi:uncharacterized protein YidB (DUF937 family)
MGLLDSILGGLSGAAPGSLPTSQQHAGLAAQVLDMLSSRGGGAGLQGLVAAFAQQGLSQVMASWVSTGQNLPIGRDQLARVLGNDQIAAMAAKVGLSPDAASSALTALLPALVDKATPGGQLPQGDALQDGIGALRKSLGI